MEQTAPLSHTRQEYLNFLSRFQSLHLSTIGEGGRPEISYAPFVVDGQKHFYIYVSALASHTGNLLKDRRAGIMFIQPEEEAENIFARKRVTFDCEVEAMERESEDWHGLTALFDARLGALMETLRSLPDFQMFRFIPRSGRFVKGFGKAYEISGERMDELSHIDPRKK